MMMWLMNITMKAVEHNMDLIVGNHHQNSLKKEIAESKKIPVFIV